MNDISTQMETLKTRLDQADAIVVGAGAGLSASAGYTYSGERFERYFADFQEKYGFSDMYTGGFYPFADPAEYWAYWSRYVWINRFMDETRSVYQNLFKLVREKDYFVLTTNVDHCFQKAGFDKQRLFYTQGDYGLFQCSEPCHPETYDNEPAIRAMLERQKDMRIPESLIPRCPRCGKPMTMNLRSDNRFVEDAGWFEAAKRYDGFIREHRNMSVLYLELGVGFNTPGIIKYPFLRMTHENDKAFYICINHGQAFGPAELDDRALYVNEDIGDVLEKLVQIS